MHDDDKDVQLIPGLENRRTIIVFIIVYCGVIHVLWQFRGMKLQKTMSFATIS